MTKVADSPTRNGITALPARNASADRARSLNADRQARYRERRQRGLRPVTVDIFSREVDALVAAGLLAEADRADQRAVGRAIGRVLGAAVELLRQDRLLLEN